MAKVPWIKNWKLAEMDCAHPRDDEGNPISKSACVREVMETIDANNEDMLKQTAKIVANTIDKMDLNQENEEVEKIFGAIKYRGELDASTIKREMGKYLTDEKKNKLESLGHRVGD